MALYGSEGFFCFTSSKTKTHHWGYFPTQTLGHLLSWVLWSELQGISWPQLLRCRCAVQTAPGWSFRVCGCSDFMTSGQPGCVTPRPLGASPIRSHSFLKWKLILEPTEPGPSQPQESPVTLATNCCHLLTGDVYPAWRMKEGGKEEWGGVALFPRPAVSSGNTDDATAGWRPHKHS